MEKDIDFKGHLSILADEYERVRNLSVALQKDNANLRARLGESTNSGSPDTRAVGKYNARGKKFEPQQTPDTYTSSASDPFMIIVPRDDSIDDISSVPSDIPKETVPDLVPEEVLPGEFRDRYSVTAHESLYEDGSRDRFSVIDIDVGNAAELAEVELDIYTSNGYDSERRGSYVSSMISHNSSSVKFVDPSMHVPIFPKWFDPGFTNLEDFEAHASRASEFSLEEWVPEQHAGFCVLMPVGWLRLSWDFMAFLVLLVDLWATPFELFFISSFEPPYAFTGIQHGITCFFGVDIMLNFITGYVEEDRTVMEHGRIIKHYLRGWFWLDLIATIPLDLILMSVGTGMFSVARLGKASKVIKTLRYLKLLRAVKFVKLTAQANTFGQHFPMLAKLQKVAFPAQVQLFLIFFAHVHCCILSVARSDSEENATLNAALKSYLENFWWAYCAITVGASLGPSGGATNPWVWLVEMILVSERLLLLFFASLHVIFKSLTFVDDARGTRARDQVLKYLRQHRVSFKTQIQVLYSLRDTGQAKKYQMHATELFANELPRELRCTICLELWSDRLTSLGLIQEVAMWHRDFLLELSLIVYEEVFPSRAVMFRVGDAASAAYHIIKGELVVIHLIGTAFIPDFTKGMWVGENALSSTLLRRSATIVTKAITQLMVVPGANFQGLISRFGFMERYQRFLSKELWKGLCGRCGMLGDHFSDTCAVSNVNGITNSSPARRLSGSKLFFQGSTSEGGVGELNFIRSSTMKDLNQGIGHFNLEMKRYFITHSLEFVMPVLRELFPDVSNLDALIDNDLVNLKNKLELDGWALTKEQDAALSEASINKYRQNNEERVAQTLFRQVSRLHHLIFLSHYKVEAGTEAALMRTELEQAIKKDPGSPGHYFDEPVFLDSDNLTNLEDIQVQVKRAHNLVLLLTRGVLTRPWVLIEIVTAIREGARIHLVNVAKAGCEFEFPDEKFYEDMENGESLSNQSWDVIRSCDITVEEVVEVIRLVLKKIAVTYSPHKSTSIRQAEIGSLLKQCQLKDA